MSIKITNLSYSYENVTLALDNINIRIDSPQIVGLVGQTGCGKSTLVQLVAGLLDGKEGSVFIDDEDVYSKKYNRSYLRKRLGIVFQYPESQLFEQTVAKDVAFGIKNQKLSKLEVEKRVKLAISLLNLDYDKVKDKSPLALSGGEKRKVAIAGVLAIEPKYLILDEPIAGLDPQSRIDFMNLLLRLKEQGTTIIIVSHNADSLAEYADRIILLDKGKIVMDSTPDDVYSNVDLLDSLSMGTCTAQRISHLLKSNDVDISATTYNELLNELVNYFGDKNV